MKDTTDNARKIGDELWQWLGGDTYNRRHVTCERMFRRMRDMSLGKMNILYNFMLAHFPDVKPDCSISITICGSTTRTQRDITSATGRT